MVANSPLDAIKFLLPSLNDKEQEALKTILRVPPTPPPKPCDRLGHKFEKIGEVPRWFKPPMSKYFCERCSEVRVIE